jgi:hypothetical protein
MAFEISYLYDYITKPCRQNAQVTQKHENAYVGNTGQYEVRHTNYKLLEIGGGKAYGRLSH